MTGPARGRGGRPAAGPAAILIGPPGAGKSTVGALLAPLLGVDVLDTDAVVEEAAGKPVGDIFVSDGESAFRALERDAVVRAVAEHPGVVVAGSGAVLDPQVRRSLAGQRVVYLRTGFAAVAGRTGLSGPHPPLPVNPRGRMRQLLQEREPVYAECAWLTVTTDDRGPSEIADQVAASLAERLAAEAGEGAGAAEAGAGDGDPGPAGRPGSAGGARPAGPPP